MCAHTHTLTHTCTHTHTHVRTHTHTLTHTQHTQTTHTHTHTHTHTRTHTHSDGHCVLIRCVGLSVSTVSSPEASHVLTTAVMWLLKVVGQDAEGQEVSADLGECASTWNCAVELATILSPLHGVPWFVCCSLHHSPLPKPRHWEYLKEFCGILLQRGELCGLVCVVSCTSPQSGSLLVPGTAPSVLVCFKLFLNVTR